MMRTSYHLIPDGSDTIVAVEIKFDLTLATSDEVDREAREAVAIVVSKLTDIPVEKILESYQAGLWTGDLDWRPDEPRP